MNQPQNNPVVSKPTPVVLDELLTETTDSNKALYDRQLEFGHLYPDQIRYPGFRFLSAKPTQYGQMQYSWGNGFTAQDSYNAAKDYSGDANGTPIFVRSYRVLRSDYLVTGPLTKGLPFTGIAAISVTAGGSGYTDDFAVAFTGGGGSGGAGTALVSNGAVVRVEITAVGTGYTSTPTVGFGAGAGAGATATASIQPAAAVLIAEKHSKLPDDDPYTSLYDKVTRIYETLPGPWLPATRWDDDLGQVYGRRRSELSDPSTQVSDLSQFQKIVSYQSREGSSIVALRIEENYSNGTGTGVGNEVYPLKKREYYDNERGNVQQTRQLVVAASQVSSDPLVGTTATKKWYETYEPSKFFLFEVIETFEVPGPLLLGDEMHDGCQGEIASVGEQILAFDAADYAPDSGTLEYSDKQIDAATLKRRIVYAENGFPALTEIFYQMEKNGRKITKLYQVVSTAISPGAPSPGYMQEVRRINKYRHLLITTLWDQVADYSERRNAAYRFPALLDDNDYTWSDVCGAFSHVQSERNYLTSMRIDHSWATSIPTYGYTVLRPITHLIGRGFQITEPTINNSGFYDYTGACTAHFVFTPSTPTKTTYDAIVASKVPQLMSMEATLDEDLRYHIVLFYLVFQ